MALNYKRLERVYFMKLYSILYICNVGYLIFFFVCALIVSFCIGYSILWLCGAFRDKQFTKKNYNPYIEAHKVRKRNDKAYEDYLDWMNRNGHNLPIDKIKTKEEYEFERKLKL